MNGFMMNISEGRRMDKFPEYHAKHPLCDETTFLEKMREAHKNTKFKPPIKNRNADRFGILFLGAAAMLVVFSIIGLFIRFGR